MGMTPMGASAASGGLCLLTAELLADRAHFRCSFTAILPCCSAAWPAPLPLSTFTAFLGFYCLCRLLLNQSTVADFVDLYCLCRLLLPLSTSTAFVGFHFAVVVGYTDFDYWMSKLADRINYSALKLDFRIPTNSVAV